MFLGQRARSLDESPEYQPISRIRIHAGEDSNGNPIIYEAGSGSGRTIDVDNPLIMDSASGQAIANNVLAALQGYKYKPYQADGAILDPVAEIGDAVSVGEVYSVLADIETTFSPLMTANIRAREDGTIDHEFPYELSEERAIQRSLAETRTSFIVEQGRILAEVAEMNNPDVSGSIANKIASLEITTSGISATLSEQYLTSGEVSTTIEESIRIATGSITSTVSANYQTKTQAQANLAAAKGYTDTRDLAITAAYKSAIKQTAQSIEATVASATEKYDLTAIPSGTTIIRAYGILSPSAYPPSQYNGQVYVDMETGNWWQSNGTKWTGMGTLQTVTSQLKSAINITNETINSEVSRLDAAIGDANTRITQTADSIEAVVNGSTAPEWSEGGSTGYGTYYAGDIVSVPIYQIVEGEEKLVGRDYYKCITEHTPSASTYPGVGQYWASVWQTTNAPTVQTMINSSLEGLTLSYESSAQPNSAYVTLNHNGVQIGGSTITMSNVQADTIAAGTSITSPYIYDSSANVRMTMDGSYPGPGVALSILNTQGQYYQFFKALRSGGDTWFLFDGSAYLTFSSSLGKFSCYGTWDFSSANVILPSS